MALGSFLQPGPYHIISYGTLLGTQFYQSFINGGVAYKKLSRPHFSALQQALVPVYFSIQTALPLVVALTYPGVPFTPSSLSGVFERSNWLHVLTPLALTFVGGALNMVYLGPVTTKVMLERKRQEVKDGKKCEEPGPHSDEMIRLNKAFGKFHGLSALINTVALGGTLWYGFTLAARLN
ncbi:MAG: hypothetical protein M1814_003286 [Vezdaea aestivalis]|nr:MAG: hypothetical protein M1814_003286 [Vezdaea aestivalis]